jgi:hypothetical protein
MKKHEVIFMAETISEKYLESCSSKRVEETFVRKMKKENGFEDFSTLHLKVIFELCDSIMSDAIDSERENYDEAPSRKEKPCDHCGCFHSKYAPCGSDDE